MKAKKSLAREYIEAIIIALLLALFIRSFVVQAFRIPSGSMIPTLLVGDQILVDKLTFKFRKPERGEIIVFQYPKDVTRDFIKRIIGLPGDKLEVRDRKVFINGQPLDDAYAYHEAFESSHSEPRDEFGPIIVPQGQYFMMGDNRENSQDSRFWGPLEEDKIIGRAFIIYWSRNTEKFFPLEIRFERLGHLLD
ncbi:MAG: signal peptidase I [Nitrospinae bacterium]|nr:signal peptidase I [Nitrospinota bacterium]